METKTFCSLISSLLFIFCFNETHAVAQGELSPLQRIALTASNAGLPVGIIIGTASICVAQPYTSQAADSKDPAEIIVQIANRNGYKTQAIGPLVVRSGATNTGSKQEEALDRRYQRFPALNGTMGYMGAVLNGWIISSLDPTAGYSINWATGSQSEALSLPASTNTSLAEVATKIVSLGKKGLWIADVRQPDVGKPQNDVHVRIFSYADNRDQILDIGCE